MKLSRLTRLLAVVGLVGMAVGAGVLPEVGPAGATNPPLRITQVDLFDRLVDVDASNDGLTAYAVARREGNSGPEYNAPVIRSINGGIDWSDISNSPIGYWTAISTSTNGATVAVIGETAASNHALYVSTNSGNAWALKGPTTSAFHDVAVSGNGGTIVVARETDGVSYSTDGGDTWIQATTSANTPLLAEDVAVNGNGWIMVASQDGGFVWRSTDGGVTWTDLDPGTTRQWQDISISDDGATVFGVVPEDTGYIWDGHAATPAWIATGNLSFAPGQSVRGAVSPDGNSFIATSYNRLPKVLSNWNRSTASATATWTSLTAGLNVLGVWAGNGGSRFIAVSESVGGAPSIHVSLASLPSPVVTSTSNSCQEPPAGPPSGGSVVNINGRLLFDATVTIGGLPATVNPANIFGSGLSVLTPPGEPGPVDIVITTPGGSITIPRGFTYNSPPANWNPIGSPIIGRSQYDGTGGAVAVSEDGSTMIVGSAASPNESYRGHASVYDWNGSAWTQRGNDFVGISHADASGQSVAISSDGDTIAIAAPGFPAGSERGRVSIYGWDGTAWIQRGNDIVGNVDSQNLGRAIAMTTDGDTIAIASPLSASSRGHVSIHDWNGSAWTQRGNNIVGTADYESSGLAIALSPDGDNVAIGSPYYSDQRGRVRVYDWNAPAWTQFGSDIVGDSLSDYLGSSVAISANGRSIAVGAPGTGEVSSEAGLVRMFDRADTGWTQVGSDINGVSEIDKFGTSVAMSADGNTVAFSAPGSCIGGTVGSITVVDRRSGQWIVRPDVIGSPAAESGFGINFTMNRAGNVIVGGHQYVQTSRGSALAWRYTPPFVFVPPPSSSPSTPGTSAPPTAVEPPSVESRDALPEGDPLALLGRSAPAGGPLPLSAGEQLNVTLDDFTPNEDVWIGLFSDPVTIATAKADARGVLSTAFAIPQGITGDHTLVIYGTESGNGIRIPVRLTAPTLPVTGPNTSGSPGLLSVLATLILTLGLTLVIWVYKRTPSVLS